VVVGKDKMSLYAVFVVVVVVVHVDVDVDYIVIVLYYHLKMNHTVVQVSLVEAWLRV